MSKQGNFIYHKYNSSPNLLFKVLSMIKKKKKEKIKEKHYNGKIKQSDDGLKNR